MEAAGSEQTSSVIMLWAERVCTYVVGRRVGRTLSPPHPRPCAEHSTRVQVQITISTPPHLRPFAWHSTCVQVQGTYQLCVAFNMCASARNVIMPSPQTIWMSFNMCASARNVIIPIPTPDHWVALNMCASARNLIIPPHPRLFAENSTFEFAQVQITLSPRPFAWHSTCVQVQGTLSSPPPQTSCVTFNICASARNVIIPPAPTQHCKERSFAWHSTCVQVQGPCSSTPTPGNDQLRSIQQMQGTSNMCASPRNVIIPRPAPDQLRSIQHVCKCKERDHPPPPQTS